MPNNALAIVLPLALAEQRRRGEDDADRDLDDLVDLLVIAAQSRRLDGLLDEMARLAREARGEA